MVKVRNRRYDPEKDKDSVMRILKEVGWHKEEQEEITREYLKEARSWVTEVKGEAECVAQTVSGDIRYMNEELDFSAVTSVATSRVARKKGLAAKLTALSVAKEAEEGAEVSGLGMFDQGFYDRLGFGTGSYENWTSFDPSSLNLEGTDRVPERLNDDDWEDIHDNRINRMRKHGGCNLLNPKLTKWEVKYPDTFGLGFYQGEELTHHIYLSAKDIEHGPYSVRWMGYENYEQFLELLGLIKNLGDQVRLVHMREPPEIQLQDLLEKPFKRRQITEDSKYENKMRATAYWQMRILDLQGCIDKTVLPCNKEVKFNLSLNDPIKDRLGEDTTWKGIGGEYTVELGAESTIEDGFTKGIPTMKAGVGAFTRMWMGVRSPLGLSVTDDIEGPRNLLEELGEVLNVPKPHPDWDF